MNGKKNSLSEKRQTAAWGQGKKVHSVLLAVPGVSALEPSGILPARFSGAAALHPQRSQQSQPHVLFSL